MASITVKHIAQKAGVSFKTVSRVINGEKGVAPETRSRVARIIEEMGYVRNPFAGALKSGRTGVVGILCPALNTEVNTRKLVSIQSALAHRGLKTLFTTGNRHLPLAPSFLQACDAVIALLSPGSSPVPALTGGEKPYLLIDCSWEGTPSVCVDRGGGVYEAFARLKDRYDSYEFINCGLSRSDSRIRAFETVCRGAIDQGGACITELSGPDHFTAGYEYALSRADRTGSVLFFCMDDRVATGFMRGVIKRGGEIPRRVGIIGFDGDRYGAHLAYSLSTVVQPTDELGEAAAEMIAGLLTGAPVSGRTIATRFRPGESTI